MSMMQHTKDFFRYWIGRIPLRQFWSGVPVAGLIFALTWLMHLSIGEIPDHFAVGTMPPYDIRADRQYVIVDAAATAAARTEGVKAIKAVYDYDASVAEGVRIKLQDSFSKARERLAAVERDTSTDVPAQDLTGLRERFESNLGVTLKDNTWRALVETRFDKADEVLLGRLVATLMRQPIVEKANSLQHEWGRGILLRTITANADETDETAVGEVWDEAQIRTIPVLSVVRNDVTLPEDHAQAAALKPLVQSLIQTNVAPNLAATEEQRRKFHEQFEPVMETIKAGTVLARRYEPYTEVQVRRLTAITAKKASGAWPLQMLGSIMFVGMLLLVLNRFGARFLRGYRPTRRDLYFLGAVAIVFVLLMRVGAFMSEAMAEQPLPIPDFAYYYLIPVAAGGMFIRFLLNMETALLFSIGMSMLAGVLFPHEPSFTAYVLIVNIVGAATIASADKRALIIRAGVVTGLAAMSLVLAIHLMRAGQVSEHVSMNVVAWYMIMALCGSVSSSIIVLALTPLAESVFDYTSDIKLLELANLNHPLLRELVIRAPGTYHHSHLVGILSEAAAAAIGANALLTRVGAYYHDIGKLRKPMYFTENQKGVSPHDRLNPHMSALIIAAHVKEGIELAKSYKLPQRVIDMIPQHHGTKMISYFYEQAKQLADPNLGEVEAKDFRYPGPKPQTREAGILLVADGVEGAVRALKEKTPARIQQTVESIVNKSFADGQLNDCDLTLRNLNDIGSEFTRILLGIYHQRVEYPREALELHAKDVTVLETTEGESDDHNSSQASASATRDPS